jgi:hypothetical protein
MEYELSGSKKPSFDAPLEAQKAVKTVAEMNGSQIPQISYAVWGCGLHAADRKVENRGR